MVRRATLFINIGSMSAVIKCALESKIYELVARDQYNKVSKNNFRDHLHMVIVVLLKKSSILDEFYIAPDYPP